MVAMRGAGLTAARRALEVGQEAVRRARRRITTVEQQVEHEVRHAVRAASAANAMAWRSWHGRRRGPAASGGAADARAGRRARTAARGRRGEERPVRDGRVDARVVLEDRPAGTQVEVADLAVAHLARRAGRPRGRTRRAWCGASARAGARQRGMDAAAMASSAGRGPMPKPSMTRSTVGRGRPSVHGSPHGDARERAGRSGGAAGLRGHRGTRHDPRHLVGLEAGAAHEARRPRTAPPGTRRWRRSSRCRRRARAVAASVRRTEAGDRLADGVRHGRGVRATGRAAGADRPDRLVGDDQVRRDAGPFARTTPRAPSSCALTVLSALPDSRSASSSPTHRMGRRPASAQRRILRPMSSSLSSWSRRRSEWPTMTHVARPSSMARRDLARVGAPASRRGCSGRRPSTPGPASASRTAARDTYGGQITRTTDGSSVAAAMEAARAPASRGRPFIFQFPATMTVLTGRIIPVTPGGRRAGGHVGGPGRSTPLRAGERPPTRSARGPAGRAGGTPPAAPRARPATPPAGPRAVARRPLQGGRSPAGRARAPADRCARRCRWLAATERLRLDVSALSTRLRWPWSWRVTSRDSASSTELDRAETAEEREDPLGRSSRSPRRGRAAAATTPGSSRVARRAARIGASSGSTTNSRCVLPTPRLSEPRARKRPRSHATRQWSRARSQSNPSRSAGDPLGAAPTDVDGGRPGGRRAGPRPGSGHGRWPRHPGRSARRRGSRRGRARWPRARRGWRRRDRGRVRLRSRGSRRTRLRRCARPRRPRPARARRRAGTAARRASAGSWRWAFASSTTSAVTRRGRAVARSHVDAHRRRRVVLGGCLGARVVVRQHDVDERADAVGVERREVLRERVALGLAGLGGHVADVDPQGRGWPPAPSGCRAPAGWAGGSCTGCPGPRTMRSARRMASTASTLASTAAGVTQTRRMPRERMIRDCPSSCWPSASSACSVSGTGATGTTWPRTASTRLDSRTPSSKSPAMSDMRRDEQVAERMPGQARRPRPRRPGSGTAAGASSSARRRPGR